VTWGPRELIAYARSLGFRPVHRAITGKTLVWQSDSWRVEVTPPYTSQYPWEITSFLRRSDLGWWEMDRCTPYSADKAYAILSAVGVLPGLEAAA